jgi:hypothetical protein
MVAKYREQKIPESAIRNLVVRELDDLVQKSFKKELGASEISKKDPKQIKEESMSVHKGTLCDNCGISPIIGYRYSCLICNYDICDYCESIASSNVHPKDHPIMKIKVPFKSITKQVSFLDSSSS